MLKKLAKHHYYMKSGEKRINCYFVPISKEMLEKSNIKEDDTINVEVVEGKIVVEKVN